jgi:hypothetical protein
MTNYEDTNSNPLRDLLDRIHTGDMVLPKDVYEKIKTKNIRKISKTNTCLP